MNFLNGIFDAVVFMCITTVASIKDVWLQLLVAFGTVLIHIVIQPLIEFIFNKIKTKIKSKQKTPENDGEFADKALEIVNNVEKTVKDKLDNIGGKNGRK